MVTANGTNRTREGKQRRQPLPRVNLNAQPVNALARGTLFCEISSTTQEPATLFTSQTVQSQPFSVLFLQQFEQTL